MLIYMLYSRREIHRAFKANKQKWANAAGSSRLNKMTNYLIKVTVELCARVWLCNANGRLYGHYGIASIGHICWRTRSFPTGAHTQESTQC